MKVILEIMTHMPAASDASRGPGKLRYTTVVASRFDGVGPGHFTAMGIRSGGAAEPPLEEFGHGCSCDRESRWSRH